VLRLGVLVPRRLAEQFRLQILARITLQYGDVYFRAIDSSLWRSSLERVMSNGLFSASAVITSDASMSDYVTDLRLQIRHVFANGST
jgi:hypothetical protein